MRNFISTIILILKIDLNLKRSIQNYEATGKTFMVFPVASFSKSGNTDFEKTHDF